uniref:hypothetical protein n=1 Tax=Cyanobium sp. TaxID=2164130 RepID=UPI0040479412
MKFIVKVILILLRAFQFVFWHTPVSVAALIGLYFVFVLFANPASETMPITNYAFAIFTALASISFGYARCLDSVVARCQVQYCGERFLHSAILFLVASIVKYFLLQGDVLEAASRFGLIGAFLAFAGLLPGFLFLGSLVNSIAALRELNSLLYERKKPGQELLKFF